MSFSWPKKKIDPLQERIKERNCGQNNDGQINLGINSGPEYKPRGTKFETQLTFAEMEI